MPPASLRTFLLVDDDDMIRGSLRSFLERHGHAVVEANCVAEAQARLRAARLDAAVVDFQLPDGDGLDVLRRLRAADASLPVVMLTAHGSIDLAVTAIKEGAEQFLTKPVELPTLLVVLERLIEQRRDRQASLASRSRSAREAVDPFLGESEAIRTLEARARRVAASSVCVLLQGESGTGKGVLARWLHQNGPRADEAFVDLNCAGLSRDLLDSELFGHEKGAFTGAVAVKPGLIEVAHRGTLFLDEVGDADAQVQAKLLKVLEEQRFRRLGDVKDRQVDMRLITATHHDLLTLVREGRFREDLLYRISAVPLRVPPVRERGRDVIVLARRLLERIAVEVGRPGLRLAADAERALEVYHWPGNVRELRNVLERAALLAGGSELRKGDIGELIGPREQPPRAAGRDAGDGASRFSLDSAEKLHIEAVLREQEGDVRRAATVLGVSRSALYQRIKKHGIELSRLSS
jgi:DNA-binding NtrC family response regulator